MRNLMKRQVPWYVGVAIIVVGALLVLLLLYAPGRQEAGAATKDPGVKTGSVTFDLGRVGTPVAVKTTTRATVGTCYQYYPQDGWRQYSLLGKLQYAVTVNVIWCMNPAETKVVSLPTYFCIDKGGYFIFDWCHKSRGSLGYPSLGLDVKWHYHFIINGLIFERTPELVFSVADHGHVWGTFYWA